jgi:uncharacterized membrane protein YfcA
MPHKFRQHLSWLIPAIVTVTSFVGGIAGKWIASDMEPRIKNHLWIAYVIAAVSLIVTIIFAARTAKKIQAADSGSSRKIWIGGNVTDSTVTAGDRNTSVRSSKER